MVKHNGPYRMQCEDCGAIRENVFHTSLAYCKECLGHSMIVLPIITPEALYPQHDISDTPVPPHRDIQEF